MDHVYIIYSHSDYADILKVQNDYMKNINGKKILFIDKLIDNKDGSIYDGVYFYDNNLNYTKRILQCLKLANLSQDFIIFIHEVDILINVDNNYIPNILKIMNKDNIDRVDLKCEINEEIEGYHLIESTGNYIFNVNPSIWKLSSYINLLTIYDYSYRDVEHSDIQEYCKKNLKIIIFSGLPVKAGYYNVLPFFTFFHISHYGHLLPKNNQKNNLSSELQSIYEKIILKYNFKRYFRGEMH